MSRPKDLPEFDSPPVVETVLSVQFENLTKMHAAHFGLFWNEIRGRFPNTEERATLEPVVEVFPSTPDRRFGIKLESSDRPPMPRVWFSSEDGNSLIQVQSDRLIRNWRKVGDGDAYPRYESVRKSFEDDLAHFAKFTASNDLGEITVNQCEVTYVNHIIAGPGWSQLSEIEKVFNFAGFPTLEFLGRPEDVALRARFQVLDGSGQPVGRLHVEVQPAARIQDGTNMYVFNLTARGLTDERLGFLDLGRDAIVRSFASLTTAAMHKIWGRRD